VEPITRYKIAKWVLAAIVLVLMPGILASFLAQLSQFLGVTAQGPIPDPATLLMDLRAFSTQLGFVLVVGGALGVIFAYWAERIPRIDTLSWYIHLVSHELVHAILAKLCGYRIKEFKLTRHGGYVAYTKPNARGNFLISLGPYLFPLIPLILTLIAALLRGIAQVIVVLVLGASLGSHIVGTAREALDQYDVQHAGRFFSVILIVLVNLCLAVAVMAVVAPGKVSFQEFAVYAWRTNGWYLGSLASAIAGAIRG
jgi:hypothetical protein